jgi:hypothetical protein
VSSSQRRAQSADDLRARFEPWKARVGTVNHVEAHEVSRDTDRAAATCELQGDRAVLALTLVLVRERGLWKIDAWEAAELTR